MSRPLPVALLLITASGFLDAYTYQTFAHVFTNAQSGNVVLFAVHLANGEWTGAEKHVPALLAFVPGVAVGRALIARPSIGPLPSDTVVLAIELIVLATVGVWDVAAAIATFAIALVSAMQNTAFEVVEGLSYTSVVTTGNLRSMSEAFYAGWSGRDARARAKARVLGAICLGFALGALAGGLLTPLLGRAAIGAPAALVVSALVACLRYESVSPG